MNILLLLLLLGRSVGVHYPNPECTSPYSTWFSTTSVCSDEVAIALLESTLLVATFDKGRRRRLTVDEGHKGYKGYEVASCILPLVGTVGYNSDTHVNANV